MQYKDLTKETKEDLLELEFVLRSNMGEGRFKIRTTADKASDLASDIMDATEFECLDIMDCNTGEIYLSLENHIVVKKVLIFDNF